MPEFNIIAEYIPSRTITAQFIPVNFDIPAKLVEKTIQANGVYNASEDNVDGYSSVTVVVPDRPLQIQELNITPLTESQTINIISGIDGYGPVNVSAVTSNIDSNIKSSNIKEGVSILGVVGNVVGLNGSTTTINPSTSSQTVVPTAPSNGFTEVTVPAVTSAIDPNIQPENIIQGKSILGVNGNFFGIRKTVQDGYIYYDDASDHIIDLTGIIGVYYYQLAYAYRNNKNLTGTIDLSNLQHIMSYALYGTFFECINITGINLSGVATLSRDYACYSLAENCTSLETVLFDSLSEVTGQYALSRAFYGCSSLQTLSMPNLIKVSGAYALSGMCRSAGLETMTFASLTSITGGYACSDMFRNTRTLTSLSFPSLTPNSFGNNANQFNNMLYGVTGCTVHFPSNVQGTIGSWVSVNNGFGGTSTNVLFDLPATVALTGADTVTYTRNPKYDTGTALAWKVGAYGTSNFTPAYYTTGTTDPQVGATIYSDSACTQAVTTIGAIA